MDSNTRLNHARSDKPGPWDTTMVYDEHLADRVRQISQREMDSTGRPMQGFLFNDPVGIDADTDLSIGCSCASIIIRVPDRAGNGKRRDPLPIS